MHLYQGLPWFEKLSYSFSKEKRKNSQKDIFLKVNTIIFKNKRKHWQQHYKASNICQLFNMHNLVNDQQNNKHIKTSDLWNYSPQFATGCTASTIIQHLQTKTKNPTHPANTRSLTHQTSGKKAHIPIHHIHQY